MAKNTKLRDMVASESRDRAAANKGGADKAETEGDRREDQDED